MPTLVDLHEDGKTIPALVQTTQMGFVFGLNRLTGEPVYPITEMRCRVRVLLAWPERALRACRPAPRPHDACTTKGLPPMKRFFSTLAALAAGAAAMYYLDPETGRRRRVVTRDKVGAASRDASDLARSKGRHTADRLKGWMYSSVTRRTAPPSSDAQLQARIRTRLGRLVSHPKAVDVTVTNGRVHLGGHILAGDAERLVGEVSTMPGVEGVDNAMRVHDEPGTVSELQGEPRRHRRERGALHSMLPLIAVAGPIAMLLRRGSTQHHPRAR